MRPARTYGTLMSGLALVLALAPAGSTAAAPAAVHRIVIARMAFAPAPAGIKVGDTIEWINEDIFRHSATADDKSFDVDLEPNATTRIIVKTAGMIHFICKYHPGMQGQLIVGKAP